jgi:hypothetical protein
LDSYSSSASRLRLRRRLRGRLLRTATTIIITTTIITTLSGWFGTAPGTQLRRF